MATHDVFVVHHDTRGFRGDEELRFSNPIYFKTKEEANESAKALIPKDIKDYSMIDWNWIMATEYHNLVRVSAGAGDCHLIGDYVIHDGVQYPYSIEYVVCRYKLHVDNDGENIELKSNSQGEDEADEDLGSLQGWSHDSERVEEYGPDTEDEEDEDEDKA